MNAFSALIDEHSQPPLREVLGRLLSAARTADIAIAHLRLAGLDLRASEAGALQRCRVIIGQLDAAALLDNNSPSPERQNRIALLSAFARSGRLEMRTAPHHVWTPDFSVFDGLPGECNVALVGAHYFGQPYARFGVAFTCVLRSDAAVQACRDRFADLWTAAYDVLPVVVDTLERVA